MHGVSRQAFYQQMRRQERLLYKEHVILELIAPIRARMPKIGGRKLYDLLKSDIHKHGFKLGRDRFFTILRDNDKLVKRRKRYRVTTDSKHRFRVYENLIKDLEVTRVHQVLVSDITYIRYQKGFLYLALVTDLYSRKIIGYDLSESLGIDGSLQALRMALKALREGEKVIHHSDRGIQYCSHAYIDLLQKHDIGVSMAAKGNPYENPVAERVNGILKDEFLLNQTFISKTLAKKAVKEAVQIYNHERPHLSLNYKMPHQVYKQGLNAA
jgi:transposase InsO family protein